MIVYDFDYLELLVDVNARRVAGGRWRCDCATKNVQTAAKVWCKKCDVYRPLQSLALHVYYDGTITATNAYEARAKGWNSYLRSKGVAE